MEHVIARRLNYRLIELDQNATDQSIGVVMRCGETRFFPWRGFIELERARSLTGGVPVKLEASRVGVRGLRETDWRDVLPGQFVQGCWFEGGVYAVLVPRVRVVGDPGPRS